MKNDKKAPVGEYIFLLSVLGYLGYYFFDIRSYPFRAVFWPHCLMGAIVALVVLVGVQSAFKPVHEGEQPGDIPAPLLFMQRFKQGGPIAAVIAAFAFYALLFKALGFNVCNLALTFWLSWMLNPGSKRVKTALVTSLVLTVTLYLVFGVILGMKLPTGKLFRAWRF